MQVYRDEILVLSKNDYFNRNRINSLISNFIRSYGRKPDFIVRTPGRVNIIGEHIDYSGYAVLPMATKQDILCAVSVHENASFVKIQNTNRQKYKSYMLKNIANIRIGKSSKPQWFDYILCGFKGFIEEVCLEKNQECFNYGFCILISSNLLCEVGLSSSSALVCSSAILLNHAFQLNIDANSLALICAKAERYIGTQGGGMDQAALILAKEGYAQFIEFEPLKCQNTSLISNYTFIIIDSSVRVNKAATSEFNKRVFECFLATKVLCKYLEIPENKCNNLSDVQRECKKPLDEMITVVSTLLHDHAYEKQEISCILGMQVELLDKFSNIKGSDFEHFRLKQRALHAYTEAKRVLEFRSLCLSQKEFQNETQIAEKLGNLLNESHKSLSELYECSHPEVDEIAEFGKRCAAGSRVIGAGWGGCVLVFVRVDQVSEFISKLKSFVPKKLVIFESKPHNGATVYIFQNKN